MRGARFFADPVRGSYEPCGTAVVWSQAGDVVSLQRCAVRGGGGWFWLWHDDRGIRAYGPEETLAALCKAQLELQGHLTASGPSAVLVLAIRSGCACLLGVEDDQLHWFAAQCPSELMEGMQGKAAWLDVGGLSHAKLRELSELAQSCGMEFHPLLPLGPLDHDLAVTLGLSPGLPTFCDLTDHKTTIVQVRHTFRPLPEPSETCSTLLSREGV